MCILNAVSWTCAAQLVFYAAGFLCRRMVASCYASVVQTGLMLREKPRSWAFTDTCDFTVRRVLPFIHECKHLLTIADVHGQKICESPRHMAAFGFAVNITSITMLCNDILPAESAFHQQYLLTCHKIIWNSPSVAFGCPCYYDGPNTSWVCRPI